MSVLVTGGTGFIGSHLVEALLDRGRQVSVLVLKNPWEPLEKENLKIIKKKGAKIIYGDITNQKSLIPAVENVDTIFHLAAISRPMRVPDSLYYQVNRDGTKNVLEAAQEANVKKFVYVSTVSVLGGSPDGHPLTEEEYQPEVSHYALSKKEGEHLTLQFYWQHGLPVTIVRPCLIYGPRCEVRLIMFKYVQRGLFPLFKNGRAKMEFCYVGNLVDALLRAESSKKAVGEIFNITDGESYEIKKVLTTIAQELDARSPFLSLPVWAGKLAGLSMEGVSKVMGVYPPFSRTAADWMSRSESVYDCSKAKKVLGYKPQISLQEGVRRTVKWYRRQGYL